MKNITSVNNQFIKDLYNLHSKKGRELSKKFIIEGYHLVNEAKSVNLLETVLIVDEKDYVEGVENILVTLDIIKKLSFVPSPQPIIGVCKFLNNSHNIVDRSLILDDIQDPGNLGTLVRSAIGFGIKNIVLSENCVDIYNDKFIRSTQGAIFKINFIITDIVQYIKKMKKEGIYIIGTSLSKAIDLSKIKKQDKYALILGNEANGVSEDVLSLTDVNVKIEISDELESLNVSVAGGIIMYYLNIC